MICPKCGTENKAKFKFCVKCGSNIENPEEVNIEQVDMGGYRSEEDYASEKNSFKIGNGTFTINDRAPEASTGMFTSDELNDTDEEFDFSNFDEPFIPKLDADRIKVPTVNPHTVQQPGGRPMNQPIQQGIQQNGMPAMNQPMQQSIQQNGMPAMNQPMQQGIQQNGMPAMNQPMQQGVQQNGMNPYMGQMYTGQPMYGQPVMAAQPQIIGYDQSGMPIYGQAPQMMYAQPVIIGYDQSGMPIYGQAPQMMYAQPVIIGYDQNGMPVYGQAPQMMYTQPMMNENSEPSASMSGINPAMPQYQGMSGVMPQQRTGIYGGQNNAHGKPVENSGQVKVSNEFWNNFFSDGKNDDDDSQDDFFSSSSHDMGSVSAEGLDFNRLKKKERKKITYMNDTPEVNADDLKPNEKDELNKLYMRKANSSNVADLGDKRYSGKRTFMNATDNVNADDLEANEHKKSDVTMYQAGEANADDIEVYEQEHHEAIMDQADKAVEALPKKKAAHVDEIDAIELPAHMQAKKTVHNDTPEIPDVPENK